LINRRRFIVFSLIVLLSLMIASARPKYASAGVTLPMLS
jgi:hypothetical protein